MFPDQYGLTYNDPTGFVSQYVSGKEGGRKQIQQILQNPTKYSYGDLLKVVNSNTSPGAMNPKRRGQYSGQAATYNVAKQNFLNSMLAKMMANPAPAPAPAPAPTAPTAPAAPQATLQVQAPVTPTVSTNQSADQVAALTKALADAQASFQSQMGQQTKSYQDQLAAYQTQAQQQFQTFQQQSQAQLAAAQQQSEESQRQMMIGLAQRDRAPAEVKMAQSGATQQGLIRRGTTGYFGRQGMRIGSLNVPSTGLTISTDAAGRAASGSFM